MPNRLSILFKVSINFGCPSGSTYSKRQYFVDVRKVGKLLKLLFRVLIQQSIHNFVVSNNAEIYGIIGPQIFLSIFNHFGSATKKFRKDVCVNKSGLHKLISRSNRLFRVSLV